MPEVLTPETIGVPAPFVFLDARSRPYRVQNWGGDLWLFYWRDKRWVSLRRVTNDEAQTMSASALPPEQAALYDAP